MLIFYRENMNLFTNHCVRYRQNKFGNQLGSKYIFIPRFDFSHQPIPFFPIPARRKINFQINRDFDLQKRSARGNIYTLVFRPSSSTSFIKHRFNSKFNSLASLFCTSGSAPIVDRVPFTRLHLNPKSYQFTRLPVSSQSITPAKEHRRVYKPGIQFRA